MKDPKPGRPKGAAAFEHISPSITSEISSLKDLLEDEGTCESHIFSEEGLILSLNQAIDCMNNVSIFFILKKNWMRLKTCFVFRLNCMKCRMKLQKF